MIREPTTGKSTGRTSKLEVINSEEEEEESEEEEAKPSNLSTLERLIHSSRN